MKIIVPLLAVAAFGFFLPPPQGGEAYSSGATILKEWKFLEKGTVEDLVIEENQVRRRITGEGLPSRGVEMTYSVVKFHPGPHARSGYLILLAEANGASFYEKMQWFDLTSRSVKIFFPGKNFSSAEEAERTHPKIEANAVRAFRALRWEMP